MYEIVGRRIDAVAEVLRRVGVDRILELETRDPQYIALKELASVKGCEEAFLIALANALVSYRLAGYGEDYWEEVSSFFRRNHGIIEELFIEFLRIHSRFNRFAVEAKISRLKKFFNSKLYELLVQEPSRYCSNLYGLVQEVSKIYRQPVNAKTIVFAAKMYSYVCRICLGEYVLEHRVDIPVDRRVALFTLTSGMVIPVGSRLTKTSLALHIRSLMARHRDLVVRVWRIVSMKTGIPPLQLDTIIWLASRYINTMDEKAFIRVMEERYGGVIPREQLVKLYREATYNISNG